MTGACRCRRRFARARVLADETNIGCVARAADSPPRSCRSLAVSATLSLSTCRLSRSSLIEFACRRQYQNCAARLVTGEIEDELLECTHLRFRLARVLLLRQSHRLKTQLRGCGTCCRSFRPRATLGLACREEYDICAARFVPPIATAQPTALAAPAMTSLTSRQVRAAAEARHVSNNGCCKCDCDSMKAL